LYSGVACITDLMVKEGLINLDFADVRAVMREMGKAMMGTGEASGEKRALTAAEAAISNPLIEDPSIKRASGLLISITGGKDMTLFEVDEAATRIREEADQDANIIVGAIFDESLEGIVRVSVVATGIDNAGPTYQRRPAESALRELAGKLRNDSRRIDDRSEFLAPPPQSERPQQRPTALHPEGRPATPSPEYSRKAAPQGLDPYGRSSPGRNLVEEDVLDIPAFLRRRAV
jgi:cell division protein FtsZ